MTSPLLISLVSCLVAVDQASLIGRCDLAKVLHQEDLDGFEGYSLTDWLCLAFVESDFNITKVNENTDGSFDYGIFQINSHYWCNDYQSHTENNCQVDCQGLAGAPGWERTAEPQSSRNYQLCKKDCVRSRGDEELRGTTLQHSLFTVFSQFGLLYSVRVFPNAAVAGPGFYAIVKFYSARDAHRAQKACDQKQLFQKSPVKIRLGTQHKAVQHNALALNSSRCQELANYYFGFNGWSKRIIKLQDLSDPEEERENEDIVTPLQRQSLKFFCALEVVLPSYECRSPGVGMAEEPLDNLEEESGKIAVAYRCCEEVTDARTEEELQDLIQAAQPLEWAQGPVQLTSDPPGLTEPWSSHSSDLPPESPHALTPLAEPGVFNYLTSSSPDHMLALPHEDLSETLVPYLDSDSAGELLAEPDKFAILHEDLDDKLTQHQKLPAAVPVLDWDQNQALVLPPRHKSKAKTVGLDQAENHQSFEILVPPLGSKSSKPTKFIVSPSNLKKDLVKHRPLAKVVVGTTRQLGKKNQGLEELQDDYLDSNMDAFYPEESLPTDFLGSPDQPPEPPEAEISSSQQAYHTRRPLPTEQLESLSQQESPEEAESFQEEAQAQHLEPTEEVEPPLLQQEALSQPSEAPEEVETSSPEEALAQPLETPKETVARPVAHHKVQQSHLHNVTVKPLDLVLTLTPEVTKEVEPSPVQQEVLSQLPEHFEEVEPLPAQQEGPSEFPEQQEGVETPVQPEDLSQPAKHPETVASVLHQETPTQAPGFPTEYVLQIPISDEVIVQHGIQHQVHSNLHNVTFQPHNLKLAITPTIIKKTKFPATQQKPPETLGEVELSSEQEQPAQPSELTGEVEAIPSQQETTGQTPEEVEPSSSEQEQLTQPSEPTGEVEPSLTQQETLTQLSDSFGVAGSSPVQEEDAALSPESPNEAESFPTQQETLALSPVETESAATLVEQPTQHSSISNVTVKPADLELTVTTEPTPVAGLSPSQQMPLAQSSVPLTNAESSASPPEAPTLLSQLPEEAEPLPVQVPAPVPSPEAVTQITPSEQQETPAQDLQAHETVPSPPQQEATAQRPELPNEIIVLSPEHHVTTVSSLGQLLQRPSATVKPVDLALTITPAFTNKVKTSPPQKETLAQSTVSPGQLKPLSVQQEVSNQPPTASENELFVVQHEQPAQPPKDTNDAATQTLVENEVTVSPLGPVLPHITAKSVDLAVALTPGPTKELEHSPVQLENAAHTPDPPGGIKLPLAQGGHPAQSPVPQGSSTVSLKPPKEVVSSPTQQVLQTQTSEPPAKMEPLPAPQGTLPHLLQPPQNVGSSPNQEEFPAPPLKEIEPSPAQQGSPSQPPVPPTEVVAQTPMLYEATVSTPGQDQTHHSDLTSATIKPLAQKPTITPEPSTPLEATIPNPEQVQVQHPTLTEVTVQPLDLELSIKPEPTKEEEPSPTMQELPPQPVQPPKEVVADSTPGQYQAQNPTLPSITVQPLNPEPTVTPEPTVEAESSTALRPKPPEVTLPNPEQVQSQLTEFTAQPLDLELTITPESTNEAESSPAMQESPAQHPVQQEVTVPMPAESQLLPSVTVQPSGQRPNTTPEPTTEAEYSTGLQQTAAIPPYPELTQPHPKPVQSQRPALSGVTFQSLDLELTLTPESTVEVEPSPTAQQTQAQPPKPIKEVVAQPPLYSEVTGPALEAASPGVTAYHVDLELTVTPEPATSEHSTALPQTTAPPPEQPEGTLAQPNLTEVTIQPMDVEVNVTAVNNTEAEPPPTLQETPSKDQSQPPTSPSITTHHANLELTITPEPAMVSEYSTTLQQTTAPPEVTLPLPNLTQATIPTVDLGVSISQQPRSSEMISRMVLFPLTPFSVPRSPPGIKHILGKKQPVQNATTTINVCKLCTCKDETLSCVGLSAKQKLHRVPEPGPNSYNGTFTILNFQGNYISYIDENIWKAYRWAEKLILSENSLTELHKDSFEGLLSLQYLNLGCNLLTELSFGTFQAWHGMQFLHKFHFIVFNNTSSMILETEGLYSVERLSNYPDRACSHAGLSVLIERKRSPSVWTCIEEFGEKNNRDMGTTQVSLTTIESILMMTLELETLILPIRMACCLCQFKNTIEVVCKTVKLHCDSDCLTNVTFCDENASIGSAEGSFMKVLQARKKSTSTELTIEPERASSDKSAVSLSAFMNEQLDFNDESDVISALNYILPYFSEGNLEDVESTLLPFIQLLFTNAHEGDMALGHFKNNTKNPSVKPIYNNSTYKNKLRKLYFLENLLDAEIQEKIDEVKKKEKTAMLIHANLLGPKFKRQIFPKKLETAQSQENSLAEIENPGQRLLRVHRVLKRPRGLQKRHFKDAGDESSEKKHNSQLIVENTAKERRLRRPSPRELDKLDMVQRPRKLVGNSFNTEPSFIKEHKAAVSSFLKQYSRGRPSDPLPPKPQPEVQNKSKDLSYTIFILEDADARVRNMKSSKPVSHSRKKYLFHKARSRVAHKTPKAKTSRKLRKKGSLSRMMLARRPLFSAVRSLINSPPREAFSSSGLLDPQENRFSELYSLSDAPKENSSSVNNTPHVSEAVISSGNNTLPKETRPRITAHSNVSSARAPVAVDFMPPVQHTNETQWEYHNVGIEFASKPPSISFPVLSPGDQFESQLNQQLRSLIPNNDVRKLIAHVIRTLKMDCSETHVQLACAKLISRTGLLMKLLSEQQEIKVSKAEWDTDQWKTDNYINESTEAQSEQKEQESSELTKEVPGYGYNNKLILAISVTVVVMFLIIMFCLIEIYSHRTTSEEEGSRRGFFGFLLRKRSSGTSESQEGFFWRRRPLWLRDMYRPLNATRKKNMAQKLHDKESSEEDEIFNKDAGGAPAAPTEEAPPGTDSAAEEPTGEESEAAADTTTE
ncbi:hypothetical protein MJG53_015447 [Ovis ammon polii x Ovis aries]|uniref:Uncharacterized protein n=1 Tax=Ovis ammon polii x Ovis aries TaxID=2918886 RepID=A0ACB9UFS4_9CETA|nr:hypothetical protein MJG53_015447 [Ovis ammon polii x Ovis aries]